MEKYNSTWAKYLDNIISGKKDASDDLNNFLLNVADADVIYDFLFDLIYHIEYDIDLDYLSPTIQRTKAILEKKKNSKIIRPYGVAKTSGVLVESNEEGRHSPKLIDIEISIYDTIIKHYNSKTLPVVPLAGRLIPSIPAFWEGFTDLNRLRDAFLAACTLAKFDTSQYFATFKIVEHVPNQSDNPYRAINIIQYGDKLSLCLPISIASFLAIQNKIIVEYPVQLFFTGEVSLDGTILPVGMIHKKVEGITSIHQDSKKLLIAPEIKNDNQFNEIESSFFVNKKIKKYSDFINTKNGIIKECSSLKNVIDFIEVKNETSLVKRRSFIKTTILLSASAFGGYGLSNSFNDKSENILRIGVSSSIKNNLQELIHSELSKKNIRAEIVSKNYDQAEQEFQKNPNGNADGYDIIMIDEPWFEWYSQNLISLNSVLENTEKNRGFIVDNLNVYKKEEQLCAIPFIGNVQMVICTDALFSQDGIGYDKKPYKVPNTIDDLLLLNQTLRQEGWSLPVAIRNSKPNDIVESFWELLKSQGYRDKMVNNKIILPRAESEKAMNAIYELCPPSLRLTREAILYNISQGENGKKTAMCLGWPTWIKSYAAQTNDQEEFLNKIRMYKFSDTPVRGFWLVGINRWSRDTQKSYEIIKMICSESFQEELIKELGVPSVLGSLYESQSTHSFWKNNRDRIKASIKQSEPRPMVSTWRGEDGIETKLGEQLRDGTLKNDKYFEFE